MKYTQLEPRFVEWHMPETLEQGVLYISLQYGTAIHLCACGCGNKTVTPFHEPNSWIISISGLLPDALMTLTPSISNQQFPCRSHYWIQDNRVVWC